MLELKYRERLMQVVRVLEELPPEKKFDMGTWHVCGTAGCAWGWAATDPWFRRRGVKLRRFRPLLTRYEGKPHWIPSYDRARGFRAAEKFFGLTENEARNIFGARLWSRGNKRSEVIARIRKFVRENGGIPA